MFRVAFGASSSDLYVAFEKGFHDPQFQITGDQAELFKQKFEALQNAYEKNEVIDPAEAYGLAETYFADGRLQEGIWLLDQLGFFADAEKFSEQFEQKLKVEPLVLSGPVGMGITRPQWGTAAHFPVIAKPEDWAWRGSKDAEIWTYHLDRILGLNLVTLAVKREINGIEYSIHPALQQVKASDVRFLSRNYNGEYPEMFLLDFLTRNMDRHEKNSLVSPLGFFVAIDNGRSAASRIHRILGDYQWSYYPHYGFNKYPRKDIVNTIANIDINEFRREFYQYANGDVVEFISNLLRVLKNDFAAVATHPSTRPLSRELRLSCKPKTLSSEVVGGRESENSQSLLGDLEKAVGVELNCRELFLFL